MGAGALERHNLGFGLPMIRFEEIAETVQLHHPGADLDVLRRASLIESRKEERFIYYSVQRERVTALVRLLTACC